MIILSPRFPSTPALPPSSLIHPHSFTYLVLLTPFSRHPGVYRDLISTMRAAPRQIPITLGNIRQELISEREQLRRKIRRCTDAHHIQITTGAGNVAGNFRGSNFKGRGPQEEVLYLLNRTIKDLWNEFKSLERPFLVKNPRRAEAIARGDYWGEGDVDMGEKGERDGGGRGNSRRATMPADEENLGMGTDGATYYRTDFGHRFIWWQNKDAVVRLADQVQRIQIRRIERDVWETEQMVRLVLGRIVSGGGFGEGEGSEDSGSSSGPDGGDGGGGRGGGGVTRRRRSARVAEQQKRRGTSRSGSVPGGALRTETMERETVKVRGDTTRDSGTDRDRPPPRRRRDSEDLDRERERERPPPPRPRGRRGSTTYEILRPGDQDSVFEIVRPGDRGSGYEVIRPEERRARDVERERDRRRDGERDGGRGGYGER